MNDTLAYAETDPLYRKYHHGNTTFSLTYAFEESYVLPISHDEVVHGKKSFLDRMPGEYDVKFAGARTFFAYMMTHPGKKLLFMGSEYGPFREWDHDHELEWFMLDYPRHAELQHYTAALNHFYLKTPALYEQDHSWAGFRWIDADNRDQSVLSYRRIAKDGREVVVILNFTPVRRENFRVGLPHRGLWQEVFSSDAAVFGGGGFSNGDSIRTEDVEMHGLPQSAVLTLPPMSALLFTCRRKIPKRIPKKSEQAKPTRPR
jgi:1,4-alpha-glucan branching enzyme